MAQHPAGTTGDASGEIEQLTVAHFDERVMQANGPVLVEFTADWCTPCKQLLPHLIDLKADNHDLLDVVSVDVDAEEELSATYEVQGLPALLLFRDGAVIDRLNGAPPRLNLLKWVQAHVPQATFKRSLADLHATARNQVESDFPRHAFSNDISQVRPPELERLIATSAVPVVVIHFADYLANCHAVVPVLNEVAAAEGDQAVFVWADAVADPQISGGEELPSLTINVNGKMYTQVVPVLADDYDFLVGQLAEARQREQ